MRGVEIGGAAKNVLAIACGAVIGRGLGESAKAALIARGFAELLRFARAYGGEAETLMGLSGLGDLVLTCSSAQSRNFAFGVRLGQGAGRGGRRRQAGGGRHDRARPGALARAKSIDMPIADAVDAVIVRRLDPRPGGRCPDEPSDQVRTVSNAMAHWLYKSEPSVWSWEAQVAPATRGPSGTACATTWPSRT